MYIQYLRKSQLTIHCDLRKYCPCRLEAIKL